MPFDSEKFAKHLREHAKTSGQHRCAHFVREALEAAGADTTGYQVPAKTYGPILLRNAFHEVTVDDPATTTFIKGDVVIFQNYPGGDVNGHIEGYDGTNWISDFIQTGFWPSHSYVKGAAGYAVYRR